MSLESTRKRRAEARSKLSGTYSGGYLDETADNLLFFLPVVPSRRPTAQSPGRVLQQPRWKSPCAPSPSACTRSRPRTRSRTSRPTYARHSLSHAPIHHCVGTAGTRRSCCPCALSASPARSQYTVALRGQWCPPPRPLSFPPPPLAAARRRSLRQPSVMGSPHVGHTRRASHRRPPPSRAGRQWLRNEIETKHFMMVQLYGKHLPIQRRMEVDILSQLQRLPGLPNINLRM